MPTGGGWNTPKTGKPRKRRQESDAAYAFAETVGRMETATTPACERVKQVR